MAARIVGTIIALLIFTYLLCLSSAYFLQEIERQSVNEINYNTAEVVSTSGVFSKYIFNNLKDNLSRYGEFDIRLKLEKRVKPGVYDTYFNTVEILDKYLSTGDRITIYIESRTIPLFKRVLNAGFLGTKPNMDSCSGIWSIKTAMIAKNAKKTYKGYDVIAEINTRAFDAQTALLVATKLNRTGKYYGLAVHEYITQENTYYGDSADETGNTGVNYIFENGDFIKEVEFDTAGREKLIRFIQQ